MVKFTYSSNEAEYFQKREVLCRKGGVTILNKEKHLMRWGKTRRLGKWKYIFLYGLLLGGTVAFLTRLLFDSLLRNTFDIYGYVWYSIVFGLIFGIGSWIQNEKRYKKLLGN